MLADKRARATSRDRAWLLAVSMRDAEARLVLFAAPVGMLGPDSGGPEKGRHHGCLEEKNLSIG